MSALHIYVQTDRVSLLTDGASYDGDGVVIGIVSKVLPLPHLSAVLTVVGPSFILVHLAAVVHQDFRTFDDLVAGLSAKVRESLASDASRFAQVPGGMRCVIYLAGISETRGPEAYALCTEAVERFRPWAMENLGMGTITPGDPAFLSRMFALPGMPTDMESFDPATHGLRILQEQRMHPMEVVGTGQKHHVVGGFAQITTVTSDRIETSILRRWDDRVGEVINPRRAEPEVLQSGCALAQNVLMH